MYRHNKDLYKGKTVYAQIGQPRSTSVKCLLLLPSGPDRVHIERSHGTQSSSRTRQSLVYRLSRGIATRFFAIKTAGCGTGFRSSLQIYGNNNLQASFLKIVISTVRPWMLTFTSSSTRFRTRGGSSYRQRKAAESGPFIRQNRSRRAPVPARRTYTWPGIPR